MKPLVIGDVFSCVERPDSLRLDESVYGAKGFVQAGQHDLFVVSAVVRVGLIGAKPEVFGSLITPKGLTSVVLNYDPAQSAAWEWESTMLPGAHAALVRTLMTPAPENGGEPRHVDDFIDHFQEDKYARFVLNNMRMSATNKEHFKEWTGTYRLFCDYNGKRYRVSGASRMGSVLLNSHLDGDSIDYNERVCVDDCKNWGRFP